MTFKRLVAAVALLSAVSPTAVAHAEMGVKDPKIAFVFFGSIKDGGWAGAQDRSRLALQKKFDTKIPYVENVPEVSEKVRQALDLFISRGSNVIVAGSYGYSEAMAAEAKAHPEVAFVNMGGISSADNLQSIYARTYESWYLAGMAAAASSKSNVLGMIEAFPIPDVVWDLNGFALGAKAMNPKAVVKVAYVNSWSDPVKEEQIAKAMIDGGADVIATDMDSPAALVVAEKAGKYSVGFQNDMSAAAPKGIITSVLFNWEAKLIPIVESLKAGKWKSEGSTLHGIGEGATDIVDLKNVPDDAKARIMAARQDIISGKLAPFDGPVKAQDGTVKIPAGGHITDDQLWSMDYLVDNVQGSMK